MKKTFLRSPLVLLLVFALCSVSSSAQDVNFTRVYTYSGMGFYDPDGNLQHDETVPNGAIGCIMFSEVMGKDFISITIGHDVTYNGMVISSKNTIGNSMSYLFTTEFNGLNVPLQLFENYENGPGNPSNFFMNVYNQQAEVVQIVMFVGIERVYNY